MFMVYFIAVHNIIAIGQTQNLYSRISQYKRTGDTPKCLGIILCGSKHHLDKVEETTLKHFEFCKNSENHDVFSFCPEMHQWIINNTIPLTPQVWEACVEHNREHGRELKKRKQNDIGRDNHSTSYITEFKKYVNKYGKDDDPGWFKGCRIREAEELYALGLSISAIAKEMGVAQPTINNYLNPNYVKKLLGEYAYKWETSSNGKPKNQHRIEKRKSRPVSEQTLTLPGIE